MDPSYGTSVMTPGMSQEALKEEKNKRIEHQKFLDYIERNRENHDKIIGDKLSAMKEIHTKSAEEIEKMQFFDKISYYFGIYTSYLKNYIEFIILEGGVSQYINTGKFNSNSTKDNETFAKIEQIDENTAKYLLILIILYLMIYITPIFIFIYSLITSISYFYKFFKSYFVINPYMKEDDYIYQTFFRVNFLNQFYMLETIFVFFICCLIYIILYIVCIIPVFQISKYILYKDPNFNTLITYTGSYILCVSVILIIYNVAFYKNITNISVKSNEIDKILYDNMNIDYLRNVCGYKDTNATNVDVINEAISKLNITDNICEIPKDYSETSLKKYIASIVNILKTKNVNIDISSTSISALNDYKNTEGVKYTDLILKAIFTHSVIIYLLNNSTSDADIYEFLSKTNINNENILKPRIALMSMIKKDDKNILPFVLSKKFFDDDKINSSPLIANLNKIYRDTKYDLQNKIISLSNTYYHLWSPSIVSILVLIVSIVFIVVYYKSKMQQSQGKQSRILGQGAGVIDGMQGDQGFGMGQPPMVNMNIR